jgi:phosphatidylglycerol:prolipoprotein diacylglycerol transferase
VNYPIIDPVIFSLGPLSVRWYGLSYLAGFALAYFLGLRQIRRRFSGFSENDVSDLVFYGAIGGVLGGRIGSVLFYNFDRFLGDPLYLLRVWEGGMSIHGGFIGAIIALWWFGRRTSRPFWNVADFVATLTPTGLGFGRLGNFANTELPGRVTESALGMHYPCSADAIRAITMTCTEQYEAVARHPSPLYQAFAEGIVLFAIVWLVAARPQKAGVISGTFLLGYGVLRFITEFFRLPDAHIGFIGGTFTMGQLLSVPVAAAGLVLIILARSGRFSRA